MSQLVNTHGIYPLTGSSDRLWLRPFGADVFVWAGHEVFEVHRAIVRAQSSWFANQLPPASKKGLLTDVRLPFCHQVVGYTLRFMYTHSLEILEYDREKFRDLACITRSALLYIGAVDLGVEAMKDHIAQILQQMARDLAYYLTKTFTKEPMDRTEIFAALFHLKNALEVAYAYESQEETLSLRRGLASLLDTLFPFLIQHKGLLGFLSSKLWKEYSEDIAKDLVYVRKSKDH
ncbi:BTB/POZ fold protein [Metarhizium album ARSEF 1941]|uniref:BTB/POZ fold protein n=1 Tax=Metarhizium album (strain ARSEF 1941) TaxID=1081103 RepID=A0A0B2WH70_METAS|nr:BTB/POZ fold protein [Metarhizium album ARSEF 1941]KHN95341.1 BTB/POZ fold protein [Metarhizium album ARSEF 1941]